MSRTTSTTLFCCMDCISDQRAVCFMIEPLSTYADGAPVKVGHSEPKTETDFQNIAHPLAASPSSPDIAEQGQSSPHLPCRQRS